MNLTMQIDSFLSQLQAVTVGFEDLYKKNTEGQKIMHHSIENGFSVKIHVIYISLERLDERN